MSGEREPVQQKEQKEINEEHYNKEKIIVDGKEVVVYIHKYTNGR